MGNQRNQRKKGNGGWARAKNGTTTYLGLPVDSWNLENPAARDWIHGEILHEHGLVDRQRQTEDGYALPMLDGRPIPFGPEQEEAKDAIYGLQPTGPHYETENGMDDRYVWARRNAHAPLVIKRLSKVLRGEFVGLEAFTVKYWHAVSDDGVIDEPRGVKRRGSEALSDFQSDDSELHQMRKRNTKRTRPEDAKALEDLPEPFGFEETTVSHYVQPEPPVKRVRADQTVPRDGVIPYGHFSEDTVTVKRRVVGRQIKPSTLSERKKVMEIDVDTTELKKLPASLSFTGKTVWLCQDAYDREVASNPDYLAAHVAMGERLAKAAREGISPLTSPTLATLRPAANENNTPDFGPVQSQRLSKKLVWNSTGAEPELSAAEQKVPEFFGVLDCLRTERDALRARMLSASDGPKKALQTAGSAATVNTVSMPIPPFVFPLEMRGRNPLLEHLALQSPGRTENQSVPVPHNRPPRQVAEEGHVASQLSVKLLEKAFSGLNPFLQPEPIEVTSRTKLERLSVGVEADVLDSWSGVEREMAMDVWDRTGSIDTVTAELNHSRLLTDYQRPLQLGHQFAKGILILLEMKEAVENAREMSGIGNVLPYWLQ